MKLSNNNWPQRRWPPMQQMQQVPPPRRRRRRRFRWELFVGLPLLLLALAWICNSVEVGFSWDELLNKWGIVRKRRFSILACLGCVAVTVVAIGRVLQGDKKDG